MLHAVEPGARLAGRYLLEGRLASGAAPTSSTAWRGCDTVLNRPVGILVVPADSAQAPAVLSAARAVAALDDPRFLAVLDAAVHDGWAYVVTEWVTGESLARRLCRGPLEPVDARYLAHEVADALTHAHRAGVAHRRLVPEDVLFSETGHVKLAGLGVAAAADGLEAMTRRGALDTDLPARGPVQDDVHGVGAILYAALTARWPRADPRIPPLVTVVPAAPLMDDAACSPRQLRAAVPHELDDLTCRTLGRRMRRAGPIVDLELLVADLAAALPDRSSSTGPVPVVIDERPPPPQPAPGPATPRARAGVAVLAAVAMVLLAWQLATMPVHPAAEAQERGGRPSPAALTPAAQPLTITAAHDFDPEGNGQENPRYVPRALDGDPHTGWLTKDYYHSPLGGQKSGVGLVLDLGSPHEVSSVRLDLVGEGTDLELRESSASSPPTQADDYSLVARADDAGSSVTLHAKQPVDARYLLIWLRSLPLAEGDTYRGGVDEVTVLGFPGDLREAARAVPRP